MCLLLEQNQLVVLSDELSKLVEDQLVNYVLVRCDELSDGCFVDQKFDQVKCLLAADFQEELVVHSVLLFNGTLRKESHSK